MTKKMIHLFLIVISLGSLSLAIDWYQYLQKGREISIYGALSQTAPQTMTQLLKGYQS